MSKFKKLGSFISGNAKDWNSGFESLVGFKNPFAIGGTNRKDDPSVPSAALPKPPEEAVSTAETPVVLVPNEDVKNQRVSGRSSKRKAATVDVLGGLGQSGLNI